MSIIAQIDGYKTDHRRQYPEGTTLVYSNWTPRKSRINGVNSVVFFGLQYFMREYLQKRFNNEFFLKPENEVVDDYKRLMDLYLGKDVISVDHIRELHKLGYLPIEIRALPEGSDVPIGVPMLTIINTLPQFFWITNYLETLMSCCLWQACTSATLAKRLRKMLQAHCMKTNAAAKDFVPWQGHDFSFRGMSSPEAAAISGAAHLLSFTGTDTVPALEFLKRYYGANMYDDVIGGSVTATEHSVSMMYGDSNEFDCFSRLLDLYPNGILSIVSDTWNLWNVVTNFLPRLKDKIMKRDGKLVIRPDSSRTCPQDIICGTPPAVRSWNYSNDAWNRAEEKGLVQCLWDTFGGTISTEGYKVLDSHIGVIYGDAINYDRADNICQRLTLGGFASTNVVYGVGSYTYQYNTRDTFGFAMKATYGEVKGESRSLFKDPLTDSGEKKSACGLLAVEKDAEGNFVLKQNVSNVHYPQNELKVVYSNGRILAAQSLRQIREMINVD